MVDFAKLFEKEAEEDAALKNYAARLPVYGVDPETGLTNYTNPVVPQLKLPVQGIHDQPYIPTQYDMKGPVRFLPAVQEGASNVKAIMNEGFESPENIAAKVFGPIGDNDVERVQTWPEKMVRSGASLPTDVMAGRVLSGPGLRATDFSDIPGAPQPLSNLIERTQDLAGLAAGGSVAATGLKAEKPGIMARGAKTLKDRLTEAFAEEIHNAPTDVIGGIAEVRKNNKGGYDIWDKDKNELWITEGKKGMSKEDAQYQANQINKAPGDKAFRLNEDDIAGTSITGIKNSFINRLNEHLDSANLNTSQAEVKAMLPSPVSFPERLYTNYAKAIKPEDVLKSEPVWSGAERLSNETGIGYSEAFAQIANEFWRRQEVNRFITPELAEKYIKRERSGFKLAEDSEAGTAISSLATRMNETMPEILARQRASEGYEAAIRDPETKKLYTGMWHEEVLDKIAKDKGIPKNQLPTNLVKGYMNDRGQFLSEAALERRQQARTNSKTAMFRSDDIVGTGLAAVQAPRFYSHMENVINDAKMMVRDKEGKRVEVPQEKFNSNELNAYLKNKGVSNEEIEALKIPEFLEGKKSVTRQELLNHLNENKVELQEHWKGENEWHEIRYKDTLPRRLQNFKNILNEFKTVDDVATAKKHNPNFRETAKGKTDQEVFDAIQEAKSLPTFDKSLFQKYDTRAEAEAAIKAHGAEGHIEEPLMRRDNVATRFAQYQLHGGSNYRELLLSLKDNPSKVKRIEEINNERKNIKLDLQEIKQDLLDKVNTEADAVKRKKAEDKHTELNNRLSNLATELNDLNSSFTTDHWPGNKDIVVHSRMNDRFIPDEGGPSKKVDRSSGQSAQDLIKTWGYTPQEWKNLTQEQRNQIINNNHSTIKGYNTLHAEEIQSDLHQKGNSEGYRLSLKDKNKLEPEFNRIEEKIVNSGDESVMSHPEIRDAIKMAVDKKIITEAEAKTYLRYADSERYGAVKDAPFKSTWSDVMIKRLIRQASEEGKDAISWTPGQAQADRYNLRKQVDKIEYMKNEDGTYELDIMGKNGENIPTGEKYYTKDSLKNLVGKEMADKIIKDEGKKTGNKSVLEGDDLEIGGEFHKKFYDEIMVNKVNAIAKKYGARVEERKLEPDIKVMRAGPEDWRVVENNKGISNAVGEPLSFKSEEAAKNHMMIYGKNAGQPIWFLKLTPELKKAALEKGFSLFETGLPLTPVDHDPFEKKKHRLVPVPHNPFSPRNM